MSEPPEDDLWDALMADPEIRHDALFYGDAWARELPDGTYERLDPTSIVIVHGPPRSECSRVRRRHPGG